MGGVIPAMADAVAAAIQRLAAAADDIATQGACETQIVAAVQSGEISIHDLVRLLGGMLTSSEEQKRSIGTGLLSTVLQRITSTDTTVESVHHLALFFCDRLQDVCALVEVLDGLLALLQQHGIAPSDAILVARAIFRELAVQSLSQRMRNKIFQIFSILVEKFGSSIVEIGEDFAGGVIAAVDGEKDPRNLVLVFSLVPMLTGLLEIARNELAEELFDVIAVYFPITFEAPRNDKFGVTGDQLRGKLSAAFCSTEKFADMAIPMLLDKLSESYDRPTKLQCLRYLADCITKFAVAQIEPQFARLWPALVEECGNIDEQVADAAATAGSSLVRVFLGSPSIGGADAMDMSSGNWHQHVQTASAMVSTRCAATLKDSAGSLQRTRWACRLLRTVLTASAKLCNEVVALLVPTLGTVHAAFVADDSAAELQQPVIAAIHLLRVVCNAALAYADGTWTHPLSDVKAPVLELLSRIMEVPWCDSATRKIAVESLGFLVQSSGSEQVAKSWMLAPEELKSTVSLFGRAVLVATAAGRAKVEFESVCADTLVSISDKFPALVMDAVIKPVYEQTRANISPEKLDTLGAFAIQTPAHFLWVVPTMLNFLEEIWRGELLMIADQNEAICLVLQSIREVVKTVIAASAADGIVDCLVQCAVNLYEFMSASEFFSAESKTLSVGLLRRITATCPAESQIMLMATAVESFLGTEHAEPSLLLSAAAILTAVEGSVLVPRSAEVIAALYRVTDSEDSTEEACEIAGQCLGSIFNKNVDNDSAITEARDKLLTEIGALCTGAPSSGARIRKVSCFVWIVKGLAQSGYPSIVTQLQVLCSLLSPSIHDERAAVLAARGFGLILEETEVLSHDCHAVVRMLYRQKIFCSALPFLLRSHELQSNASQMVDYISLAILQMCCHVPMSALLPEVDALMPLVTAAFDSKMKELIFAAIRNTRVFVKERPGAVIASSELICSGLISALAFESCMFVRKEACGCLQLLAETMPHTQIFPLQAQVLRDVVPALVRADAPRGSSISCVFAQAGVSALKLWCADSGRQKTDRAPSCKRVSKCLVKAFAATQPASYLTQQAWP
eukprot:SAG11_NODE_779_length_7207_cov_3.043894_2_plen_1078_part_00